MKKICTIPLFVSLLFFFEANVDVSFQLPLDIKLDIVFGNIEEIRDFSKKLLTSLKKADTETNDNPVCLVYFLLRIFIRMSEFENIFSVITKMVWSVSMLQALHAKIFEEAFLIFFSHLSRIN